MFLKNCIGILLNIPQPHLFKSFYTLGFPSILLHTFLLTIVPCAAALAISLLNQSSTYLLINLSKCLVIALLLMCPLSEMFFVIKFVHLKSYLCTKTYHISFDPTLAFSVSLIITFFSVPWLMKLVDCLGLWCLEFS